MSHQVLAIFENGCFRPLHPLPLAENSVVSLAISPAEAPPAGNHAVADDEWVGMIARDWADDLADARQDIYTLADGEPVDAA